MYSNNVAMHWRAPCCDKANVKKGPWSSEEDAKLKSYLCNKELVVTRSIYYKRSVISTLFFPFFVIEISHAIY
jgi:hypothetical protein